MSRPSLTRTPRALEHVCRAWPYSWLSVVIDGVAVPGGYFPATIALRMTPASCMYALGSDSSPIDILVPYSIGKVANRNASTVVERGRQYLIHGMLLPCTCGDSSAAILLPHRSSAASATICR